MRRWLLVALCGALVCSAQHSVLSAGDKEGEEVVLDGKLKLKSRTPASWKMQEPSNKFRVSQFLVPKVEGDEKDAELVIFFFGEGAGGGVKDNIKRWQGMFKLPEGKSADDISKVEEFKVGEVKVTYLDISGTYLEKFPPFAPNAKITARADYRRLGVVFDSPNGPYFITLTGPAKTMAQHKKGFDNWLKSFK